jgi:hypothetical protein
MFVGREVEGSVGACSSFILICLLQLSTRVYNAASMLHAHHIFTNLAFYMYISNVVLNIGRI